MVKGHFALAARTNITHYEQLKADLHQKIILHTSSPKLIRFPSRNIVAIRSNEDLDDHEGDQIVALAQNPNRYRDRDDADLGERDEIGDDENRNSQVVKRNHLDRRQKVVDRQRGKSTDLRGKDGAREERQGKGEGCEEGAIDDRQGRGEGDDQKVGKEKGDHLDGRRGDDDQMVDHRDDG